MKPLAAVIGFPVSHSLSPKLHNHWLKQLNLAGEYRALEVSSSDLAHMFKTLPEEGYVGWNVTIPHKEAALALVDEIEESARSIRAVNTVVVRGGKLIGSNTDAYGFMENLKTKTGDITKYFQKVVVLGAGGAARAVVHALIQEGARHIIVVNRTRVRAESLAADFSVQSVSWENKEDALSGATLLINTTSLGMMGQQPLEISLECLPENALVTDIIYKPLITPLLEKARARNLRTVTGLGMLIHQAVPGFNAWFGGTPAVTPELEEWLLA